MSKDKIDLDHGKYVIQNVGGGRYQRLLTVVESPKNICEIFTYASSDDGFTDLGYADGEREWRKNYRSQNLLHTKMDLKGADKEDGVRKSDGG